MLTKQLVVDHTVVEELVSALFSGIDLGSILVVSVLGDGTVQVVWMHHDGLTTLLTKPERGDGNGSDTVGLQSLGWIQNVLELFQDLVHVIGVTVTWNHTTVQDLQGTVHHPCTGSTLWMTGQEFLENTNYGLPSDLPKCFIISLIVADSFLSLALVEVPWNEATPKSSIVNP